MAAARRSKPRARAKRSAPSLPVLEQRHLDLLGLALVALSVFLGFVLWGGGQGRRAGPAPLDGGGWGARGGGWQGGRAGPARTDGLGGGIGEVRFFAPIAMAAAGAILVLRPVLPAV